VTTAIENTTLQDIPIQCRECHTEFIFSIGEQKRFADLGFRNVPTRCHGCRQRKLSASPPRQGISRGTVKWFSAAKGFGFIAPPNPHERDIYVHFTQIIGEGFVSLVAYQQVEFVLTRTAKGPAASNVRVIEEEKQA
jgi:CspA family cold shock protein